MRNSLDLVAAIRTLAVSANVAVLAVERWVAAFKPELSRFCWMAASDFRLEHPDRWQMMPMCGRWGRPGGELLAIAIAPQGHRHVRLPAHLFQAPPSGSPRRS